jgi:4-phospho-D-threonate 3-dehydrogenase / 4-phospho-D-erythronate 3-dehydrogenase
VALTMGDPAGIGPEICLAMLRDLEVLGACVPVIFGSARILERVAAACGLPPAAPLGPAAAWAPAGARPGVVDCGPVFDDTLVPGRVSPVGGEAAFQYITAAVARAMAGDVAALATAPVNKEGLRAAGVPHPGHTEILAALTGSPRVCMMLASDVLTVSMVTTHIGIADVPAAIRRDRVLEVIDLTDRGVARLRGGRRPLAVCGLNPHAGEHGLFGRREEEEQIIPAIEEARRRGMAVDGPLPPDTAFVPATAKRYGAIVCMYHDQGHIPFKMLAFDTGVNITLGLPIVRVSVDHGTAYDIAWKGRADVTSMRQAVLTAARMGAGPISK